jgi:hypothetical protein
MVTIIYAFQQVTGSEIILLSVIACVVLSIGTFILPKYNRGKKNILTYLTSLLILLELCDLIWFHYLFPGGNYLNRGLISGRIFFIMPLLFVILNISLTLHNKHKVH